MKEEKSFWEKLKRWIDGDEVLLDADEIISKKEKKEFIYEERIFPIGDIRSNVTLYCVLSVFVTVVFIAVMLHVVTASPTTRLRRATWKKGLRKQAQSTLLQA